jgi:Na+-driven multidrug efflux pump
MPVQPFSQPSKIIKYAFIIESFFNIAGGVGMVAAPTTILSLMARSPSFVSPISTLFLQLTGGLVVSFAVPLALGLRAGPREKIMAYQFLAAGEIILIPLLVVKWASSTDAGMADDSKLMLMAGTLLPFLLFRFWCLGWKLEWFGREKSRNRLE